MVQRRPGGWHPASRESSPSSFCTGSWDTKSLPFSTQSSEAFSTFSRAGSEAAPLHSAISATQDKSIFMEHYQESLFFTQITQANDHVDWEWGRRQELDPGAGRTLRKGGVQGSFWHIPAYFWAFPFPQQSSCACEGAGRMVGLDPGAGCPWNGCPCRIPAPSC